MKKYISLFLLSFLSLIYGQQIKSYDFDVSIDAKAKTVKVKGHINVDFQGKDTIHLVLWKNSTIEEISCRPTSIKYSFDTLSPSPIMYIPNGRKLTVIKLSESESSQSVFLNYTCDMKGLKGWAKSFTEEWIELNFYCAWFPVCLNGRIFTSKLKFRIDEDYVITGSGIILKQNDYWEMNQSWSGFDNVIIASKNLKSRQLKENKSYIQTDFSELQDTDADSILIECKHALNIFEKYFGKKDSTYLKFVIAPFEQGGGYSRKNFVRMGTKHFNFYTTKGIAHEIAHFWWNNANTTTWEDWLNEAFAEYSMLLHLREKCGLEVFNKEVDEYKSRTQNLPPIWGIDRNTPEAYSVLYEKGALILCEMENMIGKELFSNLLKDISASKIMTTNDLLELIENKLSGKMRKWLENKLKTP